VLAGTRQRLRELPLPGVGPLSSGPNEVFGSVQAYRETVQQMVHTGTLLDTCGPRLLDLAWAGSRVGIIAE
jgi:hypothetical protein